MILRRSFRPQALGPLESRLAPSSVGMAQVEHLASLFDRGPQFHPTVSYPAVETTATSAPRPSHRHDITVTVSKVTADRDDPGVAGYMLIARNSSNTWHNSVVITDRLPAGLAYVPGSVGALNGIQFQSNLNPDGTTTLVWELPALPQHAAFDSPLQVSAR